MGFGSVSLAAPGDLRTYTDINVAILRDSTVGSSAVPSAPLGEEKSASSTRTRFCPLSPITFKQPSMPTRRRGLRSSSRPAHNMNRRVE